MPGLPTCSFAMAPLPTIGRQENSSLSGPLAVCARDDRSEKTPVSRHRSTRRPEATLCDSGKGSDDPKQPCRSMPHDPPVTERRVDSEREDGRRAVCAGGSILISGVRTQGDTRHHTACEGVAGPGSGDDSAVASRHIRISSYRARSSYADIEAAISRNRWPRVARPSLAHARGRLYRPTRRFCHSRRDERPRTSRAAGRARRTLLTFRRTRLPESVKRRSNSVPGDRGRQESPSMEPSSSARDRETGS